MSRGLWFVAGASAGAYAIVRGRRAAEVLTVDGLRDRWAGLALGARLLREEVAQGQAEKEAELRRRLGLAPPGPQELGAGRHRGLPDEPTGVTGAGTEPGADHEAVRGDTPADEESTT